MRLLRAPIPDLRYDRQVVPPPDRTVSSVIGAALRLSPVSAMQVPTRIILV